MTNTASTRRWIQFSLRTMFVVVALAAAIVAYHVNWIRQRQEFLDHAFHEFPEGFEINGEKTVAPIMWGNNKRANCSAPFFLWLFGEEGHWAIHLRLDGPPEADRQKMDRAKQLFPESGIIGFHPFTETQ